ncbi:T9SS type A sorting domain-containing protein [Cryomorphaceae bacterium 1068]|nr:T9SS type A sorting domain-containing protein [Cryomorphaceae bacterium 1068]
MKRPLILFALMPLLGFSQGGWDWDVLPSMPEPVSNNSVVEAFAGDTLCVYSFTGISEGLEPEDIHLKSWRYNYILDEWTQLPDVDDFQGKIAAGASTVNNIIYLIGGYHVFPNFSEQTSEKVHRFDADANVWLEDGADIPVPVDDHVQAVWRDSLIYVITGWSQNTNVNDVQIYDPTNDTWTAATSTPNSNTFEAFGASGTIIGDTIYYYGGTKISGFNFIASNEFRKGIINPEDPTDILWSLEPDINLPDGYRMACTSFGDEVIWIGGAETAYNFDGLAYSGGAVVQPHQEIRTYDAIANTWAIFENSPFAIMDLRGIARVSDDEWIIAGGMTTNAQVTGAVYRIHRATVDTENQGIPGLKVYSSADRLTIEALPEGSYQMNLFDISGRLVLNRILLGGSHSISMSSLPHGIYLLAIQQAEGRGGSFANFKISTF